jgi:hypothetical protein
MADKKRPYFSLGIADLEKLFVANTENRDVLLVLQAELGHRQIERARHLHEQVNKKLAIKKTVSFASGCKAGVDADA